MRYELLLQPPEPGAPFDPSPVEQALEARGATVRPDGARVWTLPAGEVEVRRLLEGAQARACELRIPLSEKLDLVRALVVESAELAQQTGTRLMDPQLGRDIGPKDEGVVAEQFLRTARYAGEMMGLPEAVAASFAPPDEGLKPGTKVALGLLAVGAFVWLLVEVVLLP